MTTATRSSTSRFQPFPAMTNGRDERTPQAIGSGYGPTNWQSNIWNNVPIASKREVLNSRGSDEPFSGTPSGSGALAANSEAEWNVPWGPDNNAPSRTNSGSTSPSRTRETAPLHHSSPFFEHPNPVIGHGRGSFNMNSRPRSYVEEDKDIVFGPNLNHTFNYGQQEKRGPGEPGYPGVVGAPPSRDSSLPPSRRSTEENEHAGSYHYFTGHTPNNSIHGQRPNLSGQSSSFPAPANAKAFTYNRNVEDPDLPAQFRRSVTLEDPVNGLPNGTMLPPPTFPNPATQPFQLNPGSQSWSGDVNGSRFANGLGAEGYPDVLSRPYSKRSSGDRISTSPGGLVVSPKSYTPVSDPWAPRPSSRDLRAGLDTERRSPSTQPLMPPQASFYPPYNPNFAQFPPHIYGDPYAGAYFRAMPVPGYAMSMNYLSPPTSLPLQPRKEQDPGKGVRSALLEEFRSSAKSSKRFELKDIYNHVVEFSGDQHGSRFIQQKLETANSDEKEQIFREIEPDAVQLMKDVFGNYVIQKFFEHGSQAQKTALAEKMKRKVVNLSTQMYACRVVQKALEHVLGEQQAELVKELEPDIQRIVKDQNGNHVVQKIIELVPRQYIGFIMDSFRGHVNALATHTYGCRVIQRMLEFGAEQDKEDIMRELHASAQTLITDQYGNYVMQHVIQNGKPEDRSKMIKLVTNQLVTLSKHKFASNVVEKCIEYGTPQERRAIREQLTAASADGSSPLQLMMKDQYGNYVIQKLLNQLDGPDREYLAEEMRPQIASIRKSMPNRQIQALDRLVAAVEAAAPSKVGSVSAPSAPATPALRAEPTSAAPTPVLTMEPNSPQSSSPPSTNASAVGEAVDDGDGNTPTNLTESKVADACPDVRVQEV